MIQQDLSSRRRPSPLFALLCAWPWNDGHSSYKTPQTGQLKLMHRDTEWCRNSMRQVKIRWNSHGLKFESVRQSQSQSHGGALKVWGNGNAETEPFQVHDIERPVKIGRREQVNMDKWTAAEIQLKTSASELRPSILSTTSPRTKLQASPAGFGSGDNHRWGWQDLTSETNTTSQHQAKWVSLKLYLRKFGLIQGVGVGSAILFVHRHTSEGGWAAKISSCQRRSINAKALQDPFAGCGLPHWWWRWRYVSHPLIHMKHQIHLMSPKRWGLEEPGHVNLPRTFDVQWTSTSDCSSVAIDLGVADSFATWASDAQVCPSHGKPPTSSNEAWRHGCGKGHWETPG